MYNTTPPEHVYGGVLFELSKKEQPLINKFFLANEQEQAFHLAKQKRRFRDVMKGFSTHSGFHELTECFHEFVLDEYITWLDGGKYFIHKQEKLQEYSLDKKTRRVARFIIRKIKQL
jgi:hypothetical protein